MSVVRLIRSGLFCLLALISIVAEASHDCLSKDPAAGIINPFCQQTSLRGLWWGIPGKLVPPQKIDQYQGDTVALEVPGYWSKEQVGVNNDYPRGFVTLWAEIELSDKALQGERLALWPGRHNTAVRIYVTDGRGAWVKAYDNLSVYVPESDTVIETLPPAGIAGLLHSGASFQLPRLYPGARVVLQLYDDDYRTGGVAQPPQLGLSDELHRNLMHRWSWHILFLGASLLVAIYAASQAYFSSRRRSMHLFMVVMSLGAGVRLLVTGNVLAYMFPSLTVTHHFYFAWVSFLGLLGVFVGGQVFMLPRIFRRHSILKKILLLCSAAPILLLALIPVFSVHEFLLLGHVLRVVYIVIALFYTAFLTWQVWLKPEGQWIQLLGVIVILLGGTSDAYLYSLNVDPYIELFAVAMFVFVASQAMYFGWGYMRLLGRERGLSLRLQELNESLEGQVRRRTQDLQAANARLARAATTDVLTDLPNRRAFEENIEKEVVRAKRNGQNLCFAIADVDWFKSVNDRYGHDFGDKVLRALAGYLRSRLRRTDFVARIGGEEFAIILPATDSESARVLLTQLCEGMSQLTFPAVEGYRVSISIGCAQWSVEYPIDDLYRAADRALYQAKQSGRGRVEMALLSEG